MIHAGVDLVRSGRNVITPRCDKIKENKNSSKVEINMATHVHVCTGSCGAVISEERYHKGLVRCGAAGCTKEGQPFTEKRKCENCGVVYAVSESHSH